jgi:hypothetical protein
VRFSVLMRDGINFSNQLIALHHKRIQEIRATLPHILSATPLPASSGKSLQY